MKAVRAVGRGLAEVAALATAFAVGAELGVAAAKGFIWMLTSGAF